MIIQIPQPDFAHKMDKKMKKYYPSSFHQVRYSSYRGGHPVPRAMIFI